MKLAAVTLFVYSVLILMGGVVAYRSVGSTASLLSAVILAALLTFLGYRTFHENLVAGYVGGICTLLTAIYFAYQFLASGRFYPSGVLLIISFLCLFGTILGVFIGLQPRD